jgi:hypothetical protein
MKPYPDTRKTDCRAGEHGAAEAREVVDAWNARFPVGQAVMVTRSSGHKSITRTCSPATVWWDDTPVVFVGCVPGCYSLDRVKAVEVEVMP